MRLARHKDPIVAIATAPGRGAIGVVRVSGQHLEGLMQAIVARPLLARQAQYGPFLDALGQAIDQGLALHFPAPHSYTGEDVLELQAHGGPLVLQLLVARCLEAGAAIGLRLAEPGEFTQRAFLNGKLDLAQAEAVADLIDASTEAAARSAARSLGGAFSRLVQQLVDELVALRVLVEATLDFPEEEIDFLQRADALGRLTRVRQQLADVQQQARQGALLREGLRVVLVGQPNVGKSSLLNALAGAELAIVTPIPGTTRDRISETIQVHGIPLHVTDTAGLRTDAVDEVERIGIARSWDAIASADAVIFLHDLTRQGEAAYDGAEVEIASQLNHAASDKLLHVYNKSDAARQAGQNLSPETVSAALRAGANASRHGPDDPQAKAAAASVLTLSARTGQGIDALREALLERAGWHSSPEGVFIARARHVRALEHAGAHLRQAQELTKQAIPALDLLAEELRLAHDALGGIGGAMTPDDLLGQIFSNFCIGK